MAKPVAKESTDVRLLAVQAARDAADFQRGKAKEFREKLAAVNDRDLKSYYRAKVSEAERKARESDEEASRLLAEHIEYLQTPTRNGETVEMARERQAHETKYGKLD